MHSNGVRHLVDCNLLFHRPMFWADLKVCCINRFEIISTLMIFKKSLLRSCLWYQINVSIFITRRKTPWSSVKPHPTDSVATSLAETSHQRRPQAKKRLKITCQNDSSDCHTPPQAPRIRLANCISFCMMVTLFAWIAHKFVSSNKCTRNASVAS